ncbi:response regulator [Candidatus Viridilinea mediisalina]|uniref:Two-component system response regulator n=1 Tax=Candidatus Viridilinea mediisalina TaxID=2024553 RepID=A0A2A6RGX2_9CHLR|nr:response regulator [Candidatus Viridilinea mediisalina]PDW02183.1 two-component system response regulator [Candidatus Viridilinea mediisalina]
MIQLRPLLLVEDNLDDELLTTRSLRKAGILNELVVKRNGEEALIHLNQLATDQDPFALPTVVLLDLKLPKVNGLELLQHIRATPFLQLLPVVILTSSSEERDIVESYSLGANSYVRKPVKFDQFSEAVRQLGLYWVITNEQAIPKRSI